MRCGADVLGPGVELRPVNLGAPVDDALNLDLDDALSDTRRRLKAMLYDKSHLFDIFLDGIAIGEVGKERKDWGRKKGQWRSEITLNDDMSGNRSFRDIKGYGETCTEAVFHALRNAKKEMTIALQEIDDRWAQIVGQGDVPEPVAARNKFRFIQR